MPTLDLPGGWTLTGMGQVFPVVTLGAPHLEEGSALRSTEWYLTQPALMTNLESASRRIVLRTTLNFEGVTQEDGELTLGGWGEGFIDKRHPHTLFHELMLSVNFWNVRGGDLSISAGKGFTPFGTDDPMSRPGLKYPTNHHLSQILERWTLMATWRRGEWSLESGIFGGAEPEGPYDFSNIRSFPDSWSVRLERRWGGGEGGAAPWEASVSFGRVTELAHDEHETTELWNATLRRTMTLAGGRLYAMGEASRSYVYEHENFFSLLGESRYERGRHRPYLRMEYATRPEYHREGLPGGPDFFRYEDHDDPLGTSRWLILTAAYAYRLTSNPWSLRPFVEVQHHQVRGDRGDVVATDIFGATSFWAISAGFRLFLGGDPMRMGTYGVLDPMTAMGRQMGGTGGTATGMHHAP